MSSPLYSEEKRSHWSLREDKLLLLMVLENSALLENPAYTRPMKKFWLLISGKLADVGATFNNRQCRERFSTLYTKATRNSVEKRDQNDREYHDLLTEVTVRLSLKDGVLYLVENTHTPSANDIIEEKKQQVLELQQIVQTMSQQVYDLSDMISKQSTQMYQHLALFNQLKAAQNGAFINSNETYPSPALETKGLMKDYPGIQFPKFGGNHP